MKRMISEESISMVKEVMDFCKKDPRFKWGWWEFIQKIGFERKMRRKISMESDMLEEFNFRISIFYDGIKLRMKKYEHDTKMNLLSKKLNYFTNKNGSICEHLMKDLYRWADDRRIAKKIVDVEVYSMGRMKKYANK